MATLALSAVGSAVGSALLPSGLSVLGTTIAGATIGSQVGALAGSFVDQALFGSTGHSRSYEGPRQAELRVTTSSEGAPIPRLYGRARLGGQVIWATDFEEVATTEEVGSSGGGGKGGAVDRAVGRHKPHTVTLPILQLRSPKVKLLELDEPGLLEMSSTCRLYPIVSTPDQTRKKQIALLFPDWV